MRSVITMQMLFTWWSVAWGISSLVCTWWSYSQWICHGDWTVNHVVERLVLFSPTMVTEIYVFGSCESWRLLACTESRALLSPYKLDDEVHDTKLYPVRISFPHSVSEPSGNGAILTQQFISSLPLYTKGTHLWNKFGLLSPPTGHWEFHKATGVRCRRGVSTNLIGDMEVWVTYSGISFITN